MKYYKVSGTINQFLSVQELLDCNNIDMGCSGGNPMTAMNFLITTYPMSDAIYPYTGVKGLVDIIQQKLPK